MKHTIYLRCGRTFDFDNIKSQIIDIDDIAHALAFTNRYGGRTPVPYSVAQHSLLVEHICFTDEAKFHALIHDAAEAFIGDMTTPLKDKVGGTYRAIEYEVEQRIFEVLNFNPKRTTDEVKWADHRAMLIEVVQMFDQRAYKFFGFSKREVDDANAFIAGGEYAQATGRYETAKMRWLDAFSLHMIGRHEKAKRKK